MCNLFFKGPIPSTTYPFSFSTRSLEFTRAATDEKFSLKSSLKGLKGFAPFLMKACMGGQLFVMSLQLWRNFIMLDSGMKKEQPNITTPTDPNHADVILKTNAGTLHSISEMKTIVVYML
mmetsp:Transcript_14177/g.28264  ORF Transcript_14177/g.28264 Transcript_14177/m.28264 type:complete len:120 (+) Transcript_14177:185-544(+)